MSSMSVGHHLPLWTIKRLAASEPRASRRSVAPPRRQACAAAEALRVQAESAGRPGDGSKHVAGVTTLRIVRAPPVIFNAQAGGAWWVLKLPASFP